VTTREEGGAGTGTFDLIPLYEGGGGLPNEGVGSYMKNGSGSVVFFDKLAR
jgi:hypothetical protein